MHHLKRVACGRSSGQPPSQSWLAAVKPHHPFVDNDAYVDSSDVSLAEYLYTHVAIIYIFTEDAATPSDGFFVDVDINE